MMEIIRQILRNSMACYVGMFNIDTDIDNDTDIDTDNDDEID